MRKFFWALTALNLGVGIGFYWSDSGKSSAHFALAAVMILMAKDSESRAAAP